MTAFGKLFWLNIACFGCYGAAHLFETLLGTPGWFLFVKGFVFLLVSIPLFGLNAIIILERIYKQHFDALERSSLAVTLGFIFPALLLTLEHSINDILFPELPILNTLILFLIAIQQHPLALDEPLRIQTVVRSPLFQFGFLAFIGYLFLTSIIISAYPALPDSDPYYWLLKIRSEIQNHELASLQLYRPLFSSFVYIFYKTGGIELYPLFKYVLPFLFSLVVLPAALIARSFSLRSQQFVLFFLPLSSASLILYSEMPIPQSILNIILSFFIFFLLHAHFSKKEFFYFFAGSIMVPLYFYHEAAILIFLVWLFVTVIWYRFQIRERYLKQPLLFFLVLALLLSNSEHFSLIFGFVKNWLIRMIQAMSGWHTNFSFPISYVNVDGKTVGWGNWLGVLKYYAFYVGPAVVVSFVYFCVFFLKRKNVAEEHWYKTKEILVLGGSFCLFFILSEILPRFLSVAFLPERSWGFAGLFFLAIAVTAWKFFPTKHPWVIATFLLVAILMNIIAALYVNSLKQYLLSPYSIDSTYWISSHLPKQSVIITEKNWSILKVFTQLEILDVQDKYFYHDLTIFEKISMRLSQENCRIEGKKRFEEQFSTATETLKNLHSDYLRISPQDFASGIEGLSKQLELLKALSLPEPTVECPSPKNIYIYYSKENPKNPYADRPYFARMESQLEVPIFDLYPERFQRIYTAGEDEIIIWKVVQ